MKNNVGLYLPPTVVEEYLASIGAQLPPPKLQSNRPKAPVASVEQIDGGCIVYRLAPRKWAYRHSSVLAIP